MEILPNRRDLLKMACILLAGTGLGLAYNAVSGSGISLRTPERAPHAEQMRWRLYTDGQLVTLAEARAAVEDGRTVFVDARAVSAYAAGHIPGALNIPVPEFHPDMAGRLAHLPRSTPVITYCTGETCQSSVGLADWLREDLGFDSVRVFYGGWAAWVEADCPVDTGGG